MDVGFLSPSSWVHEKDILKWPRVFWGAIGAVTHEIIERAQTLHIREYRQRRTKDDRDE